MTSRLLKFHPYIIRWKLKTRVWLRVFWSFKSMFIPIWNYISRAILIWNQIFKIFSSCVGYRCLKNVTVKGYLPIFGPFFPFLGKMRILQKNGIWGSLYPLMPSTLCKISKKSNEPILSNIQKKIILSNCSAHFCSFLPFFGGNRHFFRKVTSSLMSYGILSLCKKL